MFLEIPTEIVFAVSGGWLAGLAVNVLLFRLGCIMADVPEPSLLRSLLLALLPYLLSTLLACGALVARLAFPELVVYSGLGASLVLLWPLAALFYSLLLAASFKKGLVIAGVELLLALLTAVLLFALIMLVLAGAQIWKRGGSPSSGSLLRPALAACSAVTSGLVAGLQASRLWSR